MTLTKTQQRLVERAKRNGGFVGVDHGYTRGFKHTRKFGVREQDAANKLVTLGLFEVAHRHGMSPVYSTGRGQVGSVWSTTFKLVEVKFDPTTEVR